MHAFQPRWPADYADYEPPMPWSRRHRCAEDVIAWAEHEPLVLHQTWPDIWHLDAAGEWRCASRASSLLGFVELSKHPGRLLDCRRRPSGELCPDYWLLVDFRHERWDRQLEVTEADAAAFVRLRKGLARHGVWLLDAIVIADDRPRWWSLNELTTGTTEWEFPANPRSYARRRPKRRAA